LGFNRITLHNNRLNRRGQKKVIISPQVRDAILLILSARSFDDIKTNQDKLVLKEELLMQLNSYLNTGLTKNIYFTSFVVR
jgi:flagellar FliL protein